MQTILGLILVIVIIVAVAWLLRRVSQLHAGAQSALKVVASGVGAVRAERPDLGVLAITHYQRLLDHLQPDHVHIIVGGRIVASGGMELAEQLDRDGYDAWR